MNNYQAEVTLSYFDADNEMRHNFSVVAVYKSPYPEEAVLASIRYARAQLVIQTGVFGNQRPYMEIHSIKVQPYVISEITTDGLCDSGPWVETIFYWSVNGKNDLRDVEQNVKDYLLE